MVAKLGVLTSYLKSISIQKSTFYRNKKLKIIDCANNYLETDVKNED